MSLILMLLLFFAPPVAAAEWARPELTDWVDTLAPAPATPADWITVEGLFAIVHAEPGDEQTAVRLSRHVATSAPRLAGELGVAIGAPMHIYLAPSDEVFHDLQPGEPPSWADGTAWPNRGLIFLRSPRIRPGTAPPLTQVLDHELVHVLLGRAFGPRPVPRWLQEGTAKVLAREYSADMTDALASGLLGDSLLTLEELGSRFPSDSTRARLAYAQSADFVAWILNTHGQDALRTVIDEMARGSGFGLALHRATGRSLAELDADWRGGLDSSLLWLKPLTGDGTWWGIGGLLLALGWVRIRRRNRRTMARWSREEALQDALYRAIERQHEQQETERLRRSVLSIIYDEDESEGQPPGGWVH